MEKILDSHIRAYSLFPSIYSPFHHTQHAYQSVKFTETVLLHLLDRIERAFGGRQIALCAYLGQFWYFSYLVSYYTGTNLWR